MTGSLLLGSMCRHELEVRTSLRTAISERGTARSGLLYSLLSLARGQSLLTRIDVDDPALLARVVAALDGRRVHLGRSRGAEFGACQLMLVSEERAPAEIPTKPLDSKATELIVWCVSDLCLVGAYGEPRLIPATEDFGLPTGWSLSEQHTHLRTRRYSPFNGKRGRPAMEREVITAGSVLVFQRGTAGEPLDPAAVVARTSAGVGHYRAEGLGRVCINPALLGAEEIRIADATLPAPGQPSRQKSHERGAELHFVGRWSALAARSQARDRLYRAAVETARRLRSFPVPPSQWGALRAFASERRGLDTARFVAELEAQFSAEHAKEAVAPAPALRERLSREEDNKRKVRDTARRERGSGGAIQKQRWQKKYRDTSAYEVLKLLLADDALRADLEQPGAAATLMELVASHAGGRSRGGNR